MTRVRSEGLLRYDRYSELSPSQYTSYHWRAEAESYQMLQSETAFAESRRVDARKKENYF